MAARVQIEEHQDAHAQQGNPVNPAGLEPYCHFFRQRDLQTDFTKRDSINVIQLIPNI
jgi:hypothetical protein